MASRYGLELRAATAADAPGLGELLGVPAAPLAQRIEAVRAGAGTVLIAVEWGPPSGVVALHWFASLAADPRSARIDCLFVAEDARRRGIGRLLVKAASQAARVAGCGTILVAAGDSPELAAFCAATGFGPAGPTFARALRKG